VPKQFEFADFVQEFFVPFNVITVTPPTLQTNGQYAPGAETVTAGGGIMLPLNEDELRRQDNGGYTSRDRKLYVTAEIPEGSYVERDGIRYKVERTKDYSDYADVYIYMARGPAK
jgi:isocitrate lyase